MKLRPASLISTLVFALLAAPLGAGAQEGKVWKLGFLSYLGCATSLTPDGGFRQGLRALGYVESRNIVIECRETPGAVDRFPALASELVRLKVDILVAESTPASLAAKAATTTIPIVMIGVADPVTSGLVTTFARPGGNVTGLSFLAPLNFGGKTLELLKEIVPHLSRVAVLRDATNPAQLEAISRIDTSALALGIKPGYIAVRAPTDIQAALTAVRDQRSQAILLNPLPVPLTSIRQIVDFAIKNTLPLATFFDRYADQGVLLSYAPSLQEQARWAVPR